MRIRTGTWCPAGKRADQSTRASCTDRLNGCGRGADVFIEASGNPNAVREGCELVRDGGRYLIVGQYTDNGEVSLNPHLHINKMHLEIHGFWRSDLSHVWRAMDIMDRFGRRIDWSSFISGRYGLDEVGQALCRTWRTWTS